MRPELPDRLESATRPEDFGVSTAAIRKMEQRVETAIKQGITPGAVLLVAKDGRILHSKSYCNRTLEPQPLAMTLDTIFDLASVSKIVGTATATMLLSEEGRLQLDDPVIKYIPEFGAKDKQSITIRDLLTHRSGLKAYENVQVVRENMIAPSTDENLVQNIAAQPELYPTGEYTVS